MALAMNTLPASYLQAVEDNAPALLAGVVAIAVGSRVLFKRGQTNGKSARPQAFPLRKIHSLENSAPLLGDLLEYSANSARAFDWMLDNTLLFNGEPWQIRMPGVPDTIFVSSPEAIEDVMTLQFDRFPKGPILLDLVQDMLGTGLVASDGERWYHQRKTAAKFFSAKTLRELMVTTMRKSVKQMCGVLDRSVDSGEQANLSTLFHEFTLQTFAELGLGVELNLVGNPTPHPFAHNFDQVSPVITRRARLPSFVWKLERWLGVGEEGKLIDSMRVVREWLSETTAKSVQVATARLSRAATGEVRTKSIVDLFVEHSRDDIDGVRIEDVVDFVLTFVAGARDTTSLALAWFFYALSIHPSVERKVRNEMTTNMPDLIGDQSVYLTTDNIKSLTYLEATIKETLRLYTLGPYMLRQASEDTVIGGDIPIRKGQWVGLCAYAFARNPQTWGQDAAEFKPERWIDAKTNQIRTFPSTKFFSFGSGPRTCIGMNLAMLELRVVTANLLNRYHFTIDPTNDGAYVPAVTLQMKKDLLAHVRSSSPSAA